MTHAHDDWIELNCIVLNWIGSNRIGLDWIEWPAYFRTGQQQWNNLVSADCWCPISSSSSSSSTSSIRTIRVRPLRADRLSSVCPVASALATAAAAAADDDDVWILFVFPWDLAGLRDRDTHEALSKHTTATFTLQLFFDFGFRISDFGFGFGFGFGSTTSWIGRRKSLSLATTSPLFEHLRLSLSLSLVSVDLWCLSLDSVGSSSPLES